MDDISTSSEHHLKQLLHLARPPCSPIPNICGGDLSKASRRQWGAGRVERLVETGVSRQGADLCSTSEVGRGRSRGGPASARFLPLRPVTASEEDVAAAPTCPILAT